MSTERLEEFEGKLNSLVRTIQDEISYQLPRKNADDRRRSVQSLERKLNEADELLSAATTEAKRVPFVYQQDAASRVAKYRRTLAALRKQLIPVSEVREELFGARESTVPGGTSDQDHLMQKTETLHRASESLKRAQQVSDETDQIGIHIIEDLGEQKESLLRTRGKLHDIDGELNTTKTLLRSIVCNTIQNRLILVVTIVFETLLLIGLVYWKFFS